MLPRIIFGQYLRHVTSAGKIYSQIALPQYISNSKWYSTSLENLSPKTIVNDPPLSIEEIHANLHKKLEQVLNNKVQNKKIVPVFKKALLYGEKIAIKDHSGEYSYIQIYEAAKKLASQISNYCGSGTQNRVAFICSNNVHYVISLWACWFSGQIAVPLNIKHPPEILEYFIKDSGTDLILAAPEHELLMQPIIEKIQKPLILVTEDLIDPNKEQLVNFLDPKKSNVVEVDDSLILEGTLNADFYTESNAMILYTSGSTGKPKGVVLSYGNLDAQYQCLAKAWNITTNDTVLHVLPLNHVHGCVNALNMPLNSGAKCIMLQKFDSSKVWSYILNVNMPVRDRINVFMGVPTMYSLLIQEYDKIFKTNTRMCDYIMSHCKTKVRLMISGSAPLPAVIFDNWFDITGQRLLERYGMTEIGMALSNTYIEDKLRSRKQGCVGLPLPGVEAKIVDSETKQEVILKGVDGKGYWDPTVANEVIFEDAKKSNESVSGNLYIRGPSVFKEYWQKPAETKSEFEEDWFKTGDTAQYSDGTIKILGRTNVDIIKSGGYKISALEIETVFMEHPDVADVAIIGLPDITWGQKIVALLMAKESKVLTADSMKEWSKTKLPAYSVPSDIKIIDELPRNAMGKINKKDIIKTFFEKNETA